VSEKARVETNQFDAGLILAQKPAQNRTNITHVSRDEYTHFFPDFIAKVEWR
jgi:hypothetical protein